MPYIATITHEAEVFLGTVASVVAIGGKQVESKEKIAVGPYGSATERFEGPDGRTITAGAVYLRQVFETAPGVLGTPGSWVYFGQVWESKVQELNAVNLNRTTAANVGAPMRNPLGLPIVLPDGTRPLQPAQGAPGRDAWTGELTGQAQP